MRSDSQSRVCGRYPPVSGLWRYSTVQLRLSDRVAGGSQPLLTMTSRTSNQGTADTAIVQRLTEQACPRDGVQVRLGKRLDAIKDRPTVLLLRVDAELLSRFEADLSEPRAVVRTHALGLAQLVTEYFTGTLGSRGLRPRLVRVWAGCPYP